MNESISLVGFWFLMRHVGSQVTFRTSGQSNGTETQTSLAYAYSHHRIATKPESRLGPRLFFVCNRCRFFFVCTTNPEPTLAIHLMITSGTGSQVKPE